MTFRLNLTETGFVDIIVLVSICTCDVLICTCSSEVNRNVRVSDFNLMYWCVHFDLSVYSPITRGAWWSWMPKHAKKMDIRIRHFQLFGPLWRDEMGMRVSRQVGSHLECLSHSAASLMSQSRRVPLLLLYTKRLQWWGWNSAAVITSVRSSMLAGLMSTMSEEKNHSEKQQWFWN